MLGEKQEDDDGCGSSSKGDDGKDAPLEALWYVWQWVLAKFMDEK